MKKTTQKTKLVLQRQTVRALVEEELKQTIAGAEHHVTKDTGCPVGETLGKQ